MIAAFTGGILIIRFRNWEQYNPPSNHTNSWFRLNSNLISRPIWDELDNNTFRVFIYMLCQANENTPRGTIHISTGGATVRCGVTKKDVYRAIKILQEFQVIEVRAPSGHFVNSALILPTNERTNETNEQLHDFIAPVFDFDSLYKKYPLKKGKTRGIAACKREIKTPEDFSLLGKAIENYAREARAENTEPRFLKHFSSFMGCWRDYLEAGKAAAPHPFAAILLEKK